MKELEHIYKSSRHKSGCVEVELEAENLYQWKVHLDPDCNNNNNRPAAAASTSATRSFVLLELTFAETFPFTPPAVRVCSPISDSVRQSIRRKLPTKQSGWSAAQTVESILLQIASVLPTTRAPPEPLPPIPAQYFGQSDGTRIDDITEYLSITGWKGATAENVAARRFSLVVNCTPDPTRERFDERLDEYYQLPIDDSRRADLLQHLDHVIECIDKHRARGGRVLVHCTAGVSRSASVVLAYLVHSGGMSLRDTYRLVKGKRPIIAPNANFWEQLIDYEVRLRGTASVSMVLTKYEWAADVAVE